MDNAGRRYRICIDPAGTPLADFPETTVPSGSLFVLGDNRDNAADGRTDGIGFVAEGNVIGRVLTRRRGGEDAHLDEE